MFEDGLMIYIYTLFFLCLFGKNDAACRKVSKCPKSYTTTENPKMCIKFVSLRMTWTEARAYCQKDHADLVIIHNQERHNWFRGIYNRTLANPLWLHLNDQAKEGTWVWGHTPNYPPVNIAEDLIELDGRKYRENIPKDCITYFLSLVIFIKDYCDQKHKFICQTVLPKTNQKCPKGGNGKYYSTNTCESSTSGKIIPNDSGDACATGFDLKKYEGNICLDLYVEELNWTEAVKKCEENNSTLMALEVKKKIHWFAEAIRDLWIGLNDRANESDFRWLDGEKMSYNRINSRKNKTDSDCMIYNGLTHSWVSVSCDASYPFICVRESPAGPSNIHMKMINNPRRDNTVFWDEPMEFVCTTLGTDTGKIEWKATKHGVALAPRVLNATITHKSAFVKTEQGECRKYTSSSYKIQASHYTEHMNLACFSHMDRFLSTCFPPVINQLFCDYYNWSTFHIIDGPKGQLEFKLAYKGFPGAIEPGQTVNVTCSVITTSWGKMSWVIFDKNNNVFKEPFSVYKPNIKTNVAKKGFDANHTTVLTLQMKSKMSGLSIACFAYNVSKYLNILQCHDSDVFCAQTPNITVEKKFDKDHSFLFPLECCTCDRGNYLVLNFAK